MFFSKTTKSFYPASMRPIYEDKGAWPLDAVETTEEVRQEMQSGERSGLLISRDDNGNPVLVSPPPPSNEHLASVIREERDSRINSVEWRIKRHERQVRLNLQPTDDIDIIDNYIQALADIPNRPNFPQNVEWPDVPIEILK